MKPNQWIVRATLWIAVTGVTGIVAWKIASPPSTTASAQKPTPPATVGKVIKDTEFGTVTLTEDAARRIGLVVSAVERKMVGRVRLYGGEIVVPPGRSTTISAPVTGRVRSSTTKPLAAGETIQKGDALFELTPMLTPDGRVTLSAALADVEGQVNNAKTQLDLTKLALERAKRVMREGAGSQRLVDEAQAAFDVASKTFDATSSRQKILGVAIGESERGGGNPISIDAPESGVVRVISVVSGQVVPSGAPLLEFADLSRLWIKVAVPVNDLDSIDRQRDVQVGQISRHDIQKRMTANPTVAPPSANVLTSTADLFYSPSDEKTALVPGQRVGVQVPLRESSTALTIPTSAIVVDANGGTWVYEEMAALRFVRKRVVVQHTDGADAVLGKGLTEGVKVVTAGAQELFGVETGV